MIHASQHRSQRLQRGRHRHKWNSKAEGVHAQEHTASRHRLRIGGQNEHGGKHRTDTGRPPQRKQPSQEDRSTIARPRRLAPGEAALLVQPGHSDHPCHVHAQHNQEHPANLNQDA